MGLIHIIDGKNSVIIQNYILRDYFQETWVLKLYIERLFPTTWVLMEERFVLLMDFPAEKKKTNDRPDTHKQTLGIGNRAKKPQKDSKQYE
jgi:hypothetical protein